MLPRLESQDPVEAAFGLVDVAHQVLGLRLPEQRLDVVLVAHQDVVRHLKCRGCRAVGQGNIGDLQLSVVISAAHGAAG